MIEVRRYYTDLSLFLFIIAVVLPRSILKTTLLLNSIFVGLIGNMMMMKNFEQWVVSYPARELLVSNFMRHTLPMFLSFIILFGCPPKQSDTIKILLILSALFLLWTVIPYQGKTLGEKVYDSYQIKAGVLIMITSLTTVITCSAISYSRESLY